MNLSSDEKQKLDKAISVTDKVKAGKVRKDAIMYIVKLAKEKTGEYPRTLKQALYFLDYLDESVDEQRLDEKMEFDPIDIKTAKPVLMKLFKKVGLVDVQYYKDTKFERDEGHMKLIFKDMKSLMSFKKNDNLYSSKFEKEMYKILNKKGQKWDEQIEATMASLVYSYEDLYLSYIFSTYDWSQDKSESVNEVTYADSKGKELKVGGIYLDSRGRGKSKKIKIKSTDSSGVRYYVFDTREYMKIPTSVWNNTKAGHYMTLVESVNEGIKKGDFVKNFSGELGLVNKVSGRTAYVKFPSTGSKSFDTVFVQYLKPSSEKHKGKPVYIEESVNEISWDEMKKIDAIHQQIKKHIEVNHKDSIDYKRDRWMKGYSDLVGHGGKSLNKKNLKNIAKLAKQKNDKTLMKLLSDLSNVSKSVNEAREIKKNIKDIKDGDVIVTGRNKHFKVDYIDPWRAGGRILVGTDVKTGKKGKMKVKFLTPRGNSGLADDTMLQVLDESVNEQLTFQQFQDKSAELNKKTSELGKVLNSFPKGEMGMVKQTPEVKKIKKEFDILFKELQNLNKKYVKIYKKELQKARAEKRMKRQTKESVNEEQLDEKLITFSNRAPYGQIVFMAGGAGSGKGFAISNFIDSAGFKVRDVDEMKKAVGKLEKLGKISVDKWYKKFSGNLPDGARKHVEEFVIGKGLSIADISDDLSNPNNVAALHFIVDAMGIKDKWLINMLKGKKNKETLPNLLFDITAKKVGSITSVIKPLLANGYDAKNIHLIWVLTNYHVAVMQNKRRARVVPDDILLKTHEGAAKTIWSILTKALPSGLDGRIDVILNNPQNTVFYQDVDGNTLKGAVKGFLSLPIKKQGGGILPEKIWLDKLYKWVSDNGPKTVDLQKPLDTQMEALKEALKKRNKSVTEAKLSPSKQKELDALIDEFEMATNPENEYIDGGWDRYRDENEILRDIEKKFGKTIASQVSAISHYPRHPYMGRDKLAWKKKWYGHPKRITKKGKMHKQDIQKMKSYYKKGY